MAQTSIQLGRIGIWTRQLEDQPAAKAQESARELDELGYGALWFGEALGREVLANAGLLLAATKRMVIATGIANMVNVAVFFSAPDTSRMTGRRVAIDSPKSPVSTRPNHFRNWIRIGLSNP